MNGRPARRGQRDLLRQPEQRRPTPRSPTARASARSPTTTRRRRLSINDVTRDRRQRRHGSATFTVTPVGGQRPDRHGQLRHRRRHGRRAGRLRGRAGDALTFAPGADDADGHGAGQRRPARRDRRDVHRQPERRRSTPPSPTARASAPSPTTTPPPTLSINDVTVTEGNAGTINADLHRQPVGAPAARRSRSTAPPPTARAVAPARLHAPCRRR